MEVVVALAPPLAGDTVSHPVALLLTVHVTFDVAVTVKLPAAGETV